MWAFFGTTCTYLMSKKLLVIKLLNTSRNVLLYSGWIEFFPCDNSWLELLCRLWKGNTEYHCNIHAVMICCQNLEHWISLQHSYSEYHCNIHTVMICCENSEVVCVAYVIFIWPRLRLKMRLWWIGNRDCSCYFLH